MDKTIYTVLIDWVSNWGEHDANVCLFSTLEKAQAYLLKESLDELEAHRGEEIYCEDSDNTFLKNMFDKFDDDFNHVDSEEHAYFVIEASPTRFSCYKQGEYILDHFNAKIIDLTVDECQNMEAD